MIDLKEDKTFSVHAGKGNHREKGMHSAPQSSLTGKTDRQLQSGQDHRFGEEAFSAIDRMREATSAKFTGGLSSTSLMLAYLD